MKKLLICLAAITAGCQTNLETIPPGEKTYRCEVNERGQVDCQPEWEFKKNNHNDNSPL